MTMTREEAIKIIDCYDIGFYDLSGAKIPADKLADAFDMATEALQREEAEEKGYCHRIRPSNVEVVVRCKDCKHWHSNTEFCSIWSFHFQNVAQRTLSHDYCSHGERREDGEE